MHRIHGDLDDVRRGTLHRRVHCGALAELAAVVVGRGKLRQRTAAAVHRDRVSLGLALRDARVHELAHRAVAGEVALNELGGLLAGNVQVGGQAEIADAVDNAEVDGLGAGAHLRRDLLNRHAVDLGGRAGVHVLTAGKCIAHRRVARQVREQAQLDLRIVRVHEHASGSRDECAPDFAAHLCAHGDVLQVRLAGGDAARRRGGLVKPGVDAAIPPGQAQQAVDVGAVQLGHLAVGEDFVDRRVET